MTKNIILLKRLLINLQDDSQSNLAEAMSVNKELMKWGFILSEESFDMLKKTDTANIKDFYTDVIAYLKSIVGDEGFVSLYNNFPVDVMGMSDSQKWYAQMTHYWTSKTFDVKTAPKEVYFEQVTYKEIKPCTETEYKKIFTDLLSVGNSITPADSKTIEWFVTNETGLTYPDPIPFKENMAIIARLCPDYTVKTVVDVLRVAVGMSGGDVSLPAVPKKLKKPGKLATARILERKKFLFKLNNAEKKRILDLFENSNLSVEDMNQGSRYGRFIRLAEIICPQLHATTHPKTNLAFHHLRNQKRKGKLTGEPKIRTWYSRVNLAFKLSFGDGLNKLSERSGEFLRKLDYLIRSFPNDLNKTLGTLAKIGAKSSNKVLFEVLEHFKERDKPLINRSVFVKGARNRVQLPNLKALSKSTIQTIDATLWQIITDKFALLEPLGSCWIDPELKKIPMPTNMRSLSESLVVSIRGQRMPIGLPQSVVIRPYVQWEDPQGTFDLDLNATFIGKNKTTAPHSLTFRDQRLGQSVHSGDVRHKKGKCAEYIDIHIENAKSLGYQYVIVDVRDYNHSIEGLSNKKSVFGFMAREVPEANSEWVPETVINSIKLESTAVGTLLCIIDLDTLEYIWVDEDTNNNTAFATGQVEELITMYATLPEFSVYDLLELHVLARGSAGSKDSAETLFTFGMFSTNYMEAMKYLGV